MQKLLYPTLDTVTGGVIGACNLLQESCEAEEARSQVT